MASKSRKWTRKDFADSASYQKWKASGKSKALPYERAGYNSDYAYRKARKQYTGYVKSTKLYPVPAPEKLRKVVESQQKSIKNGRIDRSLVKPRISSGKSLNYSVQIRIVFSDGSTRDMGRKFPSLPTVKRVEKEVKNLLSSQAYFKSVYGARSDPEDSGKNVESVSIVRVTAPRKVA